MKKFLILLAVAAISAGCKDDDTITEGPAGQNIALTSQSVGLDVTGSAAPQGEVNSVTVTSSSPWRLAGDTGWCTPSADKGENGATVTFSAAANDTREIREVKFDFICGNSATKLTVRQFPQEYAEFINVKDDYQFGSAGAEITLRVKSNLDTENFEAPEWITLARPGEEDAAEQWMLFKIEPNTTFKGRSGAITLFKGTSVERVFDVVQAGLTGVVTFDETTYTRGLEAGSLTITVQGNINFKATVPGGSSSWLSCEELSSSGTEVIEKTFRISYAAAQYYRSGTVNIVPDSGSGIGISVTQRDPNPDLFDVPDSRFSNFLLNKGYVIRNGEQFELTTGGSTVSSLDFMDFYTTKTFLGIERLVGLKSFMLMCCDVTELDLSKNLKLKDLMLVSMPIELLKLGDAPVETLYVVDMYNVMSAAELYPKTFTISGSKLTELEMDHYSSKNADKLESVDVSGCPALKTLYCNRNSGNLKKIYLTQAQKDAYTAGTLEINTSADFDKATGIVVK